MSGRNLTNVSPINKTDVAQTAFEHITYVTARGVATISLNRPEVLNVISANPGGTRDQIERAIAVAEADPTIGCIVLRGNGRSFCAGGDLTGNVRREGLAQDVECLRVADSFHARLRTSTVPIVAAIHGHCFGAGLVLAVACDLVIAADNAKLGFPEGRLGLVGASSVVAVIGRQWAKFLMLTGESLTAVQAQQLGLVFAIEPAAELWDRADDLAQRIARMPREAALLNRQAIDAVGDASGDAVARQVAIEHDALTLTRAGFAAAPDGRTFRSILDAEGMLGLKLARRQQYDTPWLRYD